MKKGLFLVLVLLVVLLATVASAERVYEVYERGASTPLGNLVVGDRDELAATDRVPLTVVADGALLQLEARPVVEIDRTPPDPQICLPFPGER